MQKPRIMRHFIILFAWLALSAATGRAGVPFKTEQADRVTGTVARLLEQAEQVNATPVTTPKDAVRLPPSARHKVLITGVDLEWDDQNEIEALLTKLLAAPRPRVYAQP